MNDKKYSLIYWRPLHTHNCLKKDDCSPLNCDDFFAFLVELAHLKALSLYIGKFLFNNFHYHL